MNRMSRLDPNMLSDLKSGLNHGILVSNLTYLVAKKMGCSEEECYEIAVSGMVHDIGKIRLSEYLYGRNEGSLDVEEMKYMRMHPTVGYEVLQHYDFTETEKEIVLHHHECYDGSGYPDHLKEEAIPMGARILKVTDTFAALISERPYRKAFTVEEAVQIMIDEVKDFDMAAFIAFQRVVHEDGVMDGILNHWVNFDGIEDVIGKL
ncbi:MAG: HD domain-containing protein [Lachnospiraceae bacterium]|nr:HD domain-containing protein [Lachnospiraceae bacterium]